MAKQLINLGTTVNDGTGDALRVGAEKINENFTELYNFLGNSSGQLSLVSSIAAEDGLSVSSPSGNILIRANIASTTDLGSVRVGTGLQISEGGVLSVIQQAAFSGDYNDLANKPDLSVYQLAANAFNGQYNNLQGLPTIPAVLEDLGIAPGRAGDVLVSSGAGTANFTTLFDQSLNTIDDVMFNSLQTTGMQTSNVTVSEILTFGTDTTNTEDAITSATAQRNYLQDVTLPGLQAQVDNIESQLSIWSDVLNSSQPGSPEWQNANSMLGALQSQLSGVMFQISSVQGQIYSLNSQISYYQGILSITTTTLHFDHLSMSLVSDIAVTIPSINLPNSNKLMSSEDGLIVYSLGNINLSASAVVIEASTLRLANITTSQRNALTAVNGDMIYNTTVNKLQGYQDGTWINLDGTV